VQIEVKLMGMLKEKTPAGGKLTLPDGATIEDALHALQIPVDSVQVFTVNGQLMHDRTRALAAHDELSILPPVGGG
jgi:sulfur carrier protein ThiS